MPPEPFFAGPGIDRADAVRNRPEAVADLLASPEARGMVWDGGVPALTPAGALVWGEVGGDEPLFLGLDEGVPRFAALPAFAAGAEAAPGGAVWEDVKRRCALRVEGTKSFEAAA